MRGREEEYDFGNCSQYIEAKLSFVSVVPLARKTDVLNVVQIYCKHELLKEVIDDGRQYCKTGYMFCIGSWRPNTLYVHILWYIFQWFNY